MMEVGACGGGKLGMVETTHEAESGSWAEEPTPSGMGASAPAVPFVVRQSSLSLSPVGQVIAHLRNANGEGATLGAISKAVERDEWRVRAYLDRLCEAELVWLRADGCFVLTSSGEKFASDHAE